MRRNNDTMSAIPAHRVPVNGRFQFGMLPQEIKDGIYEIVIEDYFQDAFGRKEPEFILPPMKDECGPLQIKYATFCIRPSFEIALRCAKDDAIESHGLVHKQTLHGIRQYQTFLKLRASKSSYLTLAPWYLHGGKIIYPHIQRDVMPYLRDVLLGRKLVKVVTEYKHYEDYTSQRKLQTINGMIRAIDSLSTGLGSSPNATFKPISIFHKAYAYIPSCLSRWEGSIRKLLNKLRIAAELPAKYGQVACAAFLAEARSIQQYFKKDIPTSLFPNLEEIVIEFQGTEGTNFGPEVYADFRFSLLQAVGLYIQNFNLRRLSLQSIVSRPDCLDDDDHPFDNLSADLINILSEEKMVRAWNITTVYCAGGFALPEGMQTFEARDKQRLVWSSEIHEDRHEWYKVSKDAFRTYWGSDFREDMARETPSSDHRDIARTSQIESGEEVEDFEVKDQNNDF
ncbi:hypothetical protein B0J14DRAFT_691326 [Halenospora varia]|nr:hypothetical protein B0J14DRAFT_691326 [Halenospora varia]